MSVRLCLVPWADVLEDRRSYKIVTTTESPHRIGPGDGFYLERSFSGSNNK